MGGKPTSEPGRCIMGEETVCCCEEKHKGHICRLKCKGLANKIKDLTRTPNVACFNCGEEANSADNVCSPVTLFI
jgi:hypothetical protein